MLIGVVAISFFGISAVSAQERVAAPETHTKISVDSVAEAAQGHTSAVETHVNRKKVMTTEVRSAGSIPNGYKYAKLSSPARMEVSDESGWLATFTNGSRTVSLRGVQRSFTEASTTAASVTHSTWVRVMQNPFDGSVDEALLKSLLTDTTPDVLAIAMQYTPGSGKILSNGLVVASDAEYGPLQDDGTRQEGSDFNDYLGVSKQYGSTVDTPEANQFNSLDCSGYIRMIFGYREGIPLGLEPDGSNSYIPRRAIQMYESGPGTVLLSQGATTVAVLSGLNPGDLVFQDASTNDGTAIDHVGIYVGKDNQGNYRFISSRKTANGPTMGDVGGKSILNGNGLYAHTFVAARRI